MQRNDHRSWITTLIVVIGQAARAGNAQTARLVLVLAVVAAAVALIVTTSR